MRSVYLIMRLVDESILLRIMNNLFCSEKRNQDISYSFTNFIDCKPNRNKDTKKNKSNGRLIWAVGIDLTRKKIKVIPSEGEKVSSLSWKVDCEICRDRKNRYTWGTIKTDFNPTMAHGGRTFWLVHTKLKKVLFKVNKRMSLPEVNKLNCFVVHPWVCLFSIL